MGIGKTSCKKMAAHNKQIEQEESRRQRAAAEYATSTQNATDELESSTSSLNSEDTSSDLPLIKNNHSHEENSLPLKRPCNVVTGKVAGALDRTQISDRQAAQLLVPFVG